MTTVKLKELIQTEERYMILRELQAGEHYLEVPTCPHSENNRENINIRSCRGCSHYKGQYNKVKKHYIFCDYFKYIVKTDDKIISKIEYEKMKIELYGKPTFGIEFEFSFIDNHNHFVHDPFALPSKGAHISGWDNPEEGTAGVELTTPIFTTIANAVDDLKRQWAFWKRRNPNFMPCFLGNCPPFRNQGQHFHIGVLNGLRNDTDKELIASHIYPILPYLIAFHANSPSSSYKTTRVARGQWATFTDMKMQNDSKNCELNNHGQGTIEVRALDANIPQVSLTMASLLQPLVKKILVNKHEPLVSYKLNTYKRMRRIALSKGLEELNPDNFLFTYLMNYENDLDLSDAPSCVREILYLGLVKKISVSDIYNHIPDGLRYSWFDVMSKNPDLLFDNFKELGLSNVFNAFSPYELTKEDIANAQHIKNLTDLLNFKYPNQRNVALFCALAFKNNNIRAMRKIYKQPKRLVKKLKAFLSLPIDRALDVKLRQFEIYAKLLRPELIEAIKQKERRDTLLKIKKLITNNLKKINITRIGENKHLDVNEIAKTISLCLNGRLNSHRVLELGDRFYIAEYKNMVLGFVSVHISSGRIANLYVLPEVRRLGVGVILIKNILRIENDLRPIQNVYAPISPDNEVAKQFFRRIGFYNVGVIKKVKDKPKTVKEKENEGWVSDGNGNIHRANRESPFNPENFDFHRYMNSTSKQTTKADEDAKGEIWVREVMLKDKILTQAKHRIITTRTVVRKELKKYKKLKSAEKKDYVRLTFNHDTNQNLTADEFVALIKAVKGDNNAWDSIKTIIMKQFIDGILNPQNAKERRNFLEYINYEPRDSSLMASIVPSPTFEDIRSRAEVLYDTETNEGDPEFDELSERDQRSWLEAGQRDLVSRSRRRRRRTPNVDINFIRQLETHGENRQPISSDNELVCPHCSYTHTHELPNGQCRRCGRTIITSLTCPECGSDNWTRDSSHYVCNGCGHLWG